MLGSIWENIGGWKQKALGGSLAIALGGMALQTQEKPAEPQAVSESRYREIPAEPAAIPRGSGSASTNFSELPAIERVKDFNFKKPTWGSATTRLGVSFFVAFLVAALLRMFVRTVASVAAIGVIGFMAARHFGIIDPFWDPDLGFIQTSKDWMFAQTDTVKAFLKGYLPSTGAAGGGFFLGMRK